MLAESAYSNLKLRIWVLQSKKRCF